MKKIKKLTALLLTLVMSLALAVPCFAADMTDTGEYYGTIWGMDRAGNRIPVLVDEIDDGSHDPDGAVPLGISYALFTMYLTDMRHSIHTVKEKSFTRNDLEWGYVRLEGIIESENPDVIVGFAYYDGGFQPTDWLNHIYECGKYFEDSYPQSDFSSLYYYYGYAQSRTPGSGSHSGAVHYWDSDR